MRTEYMMHNEVQGPYSYSCPRCRVEMQLPRPASLSDRRHRVTCSGCQQVWQFTYALLLDRESGVPRLVAYDVPEQPVEV